MNQIIILSCTVQNIYCRNNSKNIEFVHSFNNTYLHGTTQKSYLLEDFSATVEKDVNSVETTVSHIYESIAVSVSNKLIQCGLYA